MVLFLNWKTSKLQRKWVNQDIHISMSMKRQNYLDFSSQHPWDNTMAQQHISHLSTHTHTHIHTNISFLSRINLFLSCWFPAMAYWDFVHTRMPRNHEDEQEAHQESDISLMNENAKKDQEGYNQCGNKLSRGLWRRLTISVTEWASVCEIGQLERQEGQHPLWSASRRKGGHHTAHPNDTLG